ncbi:hypothetical protein Acr_12g0001480 [Actinidia rufa]|uniref:Uncharacterized protein n=1 Tax=Actinidia rufa TaxID=165716 RepID=A0A7J0FI78_9ERIC|nr:hypothetical protein Acr_12g0001480 [Actinidia rufa]
MPVLSATPALAEETKVELIKAEETATTEEVVTPPPPPPPSATEPEKAIETTVTPEEPVAPEPEAPATEAETKEVGKAEVEVASEVESSHKVAPEPVEEEIVKAQPEPDPEPETKPEPEPESVTEAPKDEVGAEEEKPAEGEEEVGTEASVEKTE